MLRDRAVWGCASTGASRGSRTIRSRKGGVQFIGRGGRRAEGAAALPRSQHQAALCSTLVGRVQRGRVRRIAAAC